CRMEKHYYKASHAHTEYEHLRTANIDYNLDNLQVSSVNCLGFHQILKLAKHWDVKSVVYLSSIGVIGTPFVHPITELHPPNPKTAYHASKLYGEYLGLIANTAGVSCAILRLSSPIGLGMPKNKIVSRFVSRACENKPLEILGNGTRKQNYVDVRDISSAIEQCLTKSVHGIYNIGGSECISNLDLAKECIVTLNSTSNIEYTNMIDVEEGVVWDLSIEKAKCDFAYCPKYTLKQSISDISVDYETCNHK
ncbi:MAG: SDR family oxidoreductase, partial [Methanosarcinaceae archaeon]|nr:SDR family oxidoreductase [Methanosarcinaceae archaeon]